MITIKDPFTSHLIKETLSNVVKNMEKRWGLTLVSFLPSDAQEHIRDLQIEISKIASGKDHNDLYHGRSFIKFYSPLSFHNTHYTLRRSDPRGRVKTEDVLKKGGNLYDLFKVINRVSSHIQPIKVKLNRLTFENNGLGIILVGECDDENSVRNRRTLLKELNEYLPKFFNISARKMDFDVSQFSKLHCTLGYLKRPIAIKYQSFVKKVRNIKFNPPIFTLKDVDLVHHKYRTLQSPSEGNINLTLGRKTDLIEKEFICKLRLA